VDIIQAVHGVAAIFICDGKVLACRKAVGKANEGLWEFPGGKVEQREDPKNALIREIYE
jgi:8-oxo-dGTP diphosphatase